MVQSIADSNEAARVVSSKPLVMVKFSATWCGPCKAVAPLIDRLEPQYPKVYMCDVDIEQCGEFASQYTVSAVPTFIFFNGGTEVDRVRGGDIARITATLQELSAQGPSFGRGQRVGGASTGAVPSLDKIREARARAFVENRDGRGKTETVKVSPVQPKRTTLKRPSLPEWSLSTLISSFMSYVVLYFATLFSFDARARAASLSHWASNGNNVYPSGQ